MPSNRVRIIVRCEDLQQRTFFYRYLVRRGYDMRSVNIENSPRGKGSGEQWVLKQYATEVAALRNRPGASKALISIVDADVNSVASRKQRHDEALAADGQERRADDEKIAVVVPKRNIETWIHHLLGTVVNESVDYTKFRREERRCAPAVEEFVRRCAAGMSPDEPPSLMDGCAELKRIE